MAAGAVVFYQHAIEDLMKGLLDLASATIMLSLVSHSYSPNAKSHSLYSADVSANVVTAAGYADRSLDGKSVARTSGSYATWDGDDITHSATGTIKAKYLVAWKQSNHRLVCYFDLETTSTTGVEVTQLVTQWNALGIGQASSAA